MMKSIFTTLFLIFSVSLSAQYAKTYAIIKKLEERRGINQNLEQINIDNKKFVLIKDFEDHTERLIVSVNGNNLTYVELFDDKATGKTSSNVFTGDVVRTRNNMVSMRADKLEGQKIALPVAKTFLLTRQDDIIYLVDVNSREKWIDEKSFSRK